MIMERNDYTRDFHSNAILKKDKNALNQHRIRKNEIQRINTTENEIHSLKEEISELKKWISELKGKE